MKLLLLAVSAGASPDPKEVLFRFRRGEGPVKVKQVDFRGLKCTDVTARMKVDGMEWRFDAIKGRFYGGVLAGDVVVDRGKRGRPFKLRLSVGGARLELITKVFAGREVSGRVSAELELTYKGTGTKHLAGRGSAMITGAEMGRFPVIVKLLSFLSFPKLKRDVMEEAEFHFVLTPRGVVFQFAEVRTGNAALTLRVRRNSCLRYDGGLDFVIEPHIESSFLKHIPGLGDIVKELVGLFGRSSMRVKVSGSLKEPEVSWAPLR